jgi:P63C domain
MEKEELKSELFSELSKLGAAKGGRARASVLTADERSEIARKAVRARWEKAGKLKIVERVGTGRTLPQGTLPYSMFRGNVKIGDMNVECHVLNDLRRVLTQREVVRVLSGGRESGNLARYLSRNPLFQDDFESGPMIQFRVPGVSQIANGYEATLLIEICETYLEARDQRLLKPSQLKLATQAEIVMRACAKVGIIALIDEATGYQEVRAKHALQIKLQAFIADEMQEWARMFPDEFWFELARLEGIHYSPRSRPLRWGKYIMMFVYDAIDADVGRQLRTKNPNPHFLQNHHQWLKKYGQDKVRSQIDKVVTIMKLCENMEEFRAKFARVFKKTPLQVSFDEINWTAGETGQT